MPRAAAGSGFIGSEMAARGPSHPHAEPAQQRQQAGPLTPPGPVLPIGGVAPRMSTRPTPPRPSASQLPAMLDSFSDIFLASEVAPC